MLPALPCVRMSPSSHPCLCLCLCCVALRLCCADIKPSNMLLDRGSVKLADFGCSATVNLAGDGDK